MQARRLPVMKHIRYIDQELVSARTDALGGGQ